MTRNQKNWGLLIFLFAVTLLFFLIVPPISQDMTYHNFSDTKRLLGVPNYLNVLSNFFLFCAGIWGFVLMCRGRITHDNAKGYPAYFIFFAGIIFTSLGSALYHWIPGNETLIWDRIPMTISFSALTVALASEYLVPGSEKVLLYPSLGYGIFSVVYWYFTEQYGQGDLRFYAVVQFLPLLIIPVLFAFFQSRYTHDKYILIALAFYALGKAAEHFDQAILSLSGFMSGHTLKHLCVAIAICYVVRMLRFRQVRSPVIQSK